MPLATSNGAQLRLRKLLKQNETVIRTFQAARASFHFGPWRHVARAAIRWRRPPRRAEAGAASLVPLDVPKLVGALHADGMARAGVLPPDVLQPLLALVADLPPGEYGMAHEHPALGALVFDPNVRDVVRGYLGAEPELLECNVVVGRAEHASEPKGQQRYFHFDTAGWHSLNLFVYLTDADEASGGHQMIVGTHRRRSFRDAVRPWIEEDEIMARYPGRLRTILGPAGTMFFEDTESFHRRLMLSRRRVLLNVVFASHRSWASHGRNVPKLLDHLESRSIADSAPDLAAGLMG